MPALVEDAPSFEMFKVEAMDEKTISQGAQKCRPKVDNYIWEHILCQVDHTLAKRNISLCDIDRKQK